MDIVHSPEDEAKRQPELEWFTDESFWRTFGPLMFGPDQFSEAESQVEDLFELLGIVPTAQTPTEMPLQVLDLGCGPGRHALPLARAGLEVTAVDTSAFLLNQLRQQAEADQLAIKTVEQDMRRYCQPDTFDLALVMWTSFGYFEDEADHRQVLSNIFDGLKSGGQLILDLVGLEYLCRSLEPVHLTETDAGYTLIERPALTDDLTRLENEWILIQSEPDGTESVHRQLFSHRVWSAGEITQWLKQTGFDSVLVYGDLFGSEYTIESERQIMLATKP